MENCKHKLDCPSYPQDCEECREKSKWYRELSKSEQEAIIREEMKAFMKFVNTVNEISRNTTINA